MREISDETDYIPLYLGVVGHRDIGDEQKPRLKLLIKQVLEEKKTQCPNTPIVVLTPLAEGADRLAAHSAIECGLSFIAILPMPLDEYKKDFNTQESLKEFNDLLEKADYWFELPLQGDAKVLSLQSSKNRNEQYYNLGFHIARQSHMLIALWDGNINNKRGGTAHIVNLKVTGMPAFHPYFKHRLKNLQTGPVCHILTPRKGEIHPPDAYGVKMIYGENPEKNKKSAEADHQLLNNIDSFNRDIKKKREVFREKSELIQQNHSNGDLILEESKKFRLILRYHAITDILATHFQSRRFFALKVLLILAVIAFVFFQIYVEFWHKPLILLLYPITIGIGALWFIRANRKRFEQKHEDYRSLSEALRVQYYLSIIDKNINVSDYYLQKHKGELEWVTYVLRALHFKCTKYDAGSDNSHDMNSLNNCKFISEQWVKEQSRYYRMKGEYYDRHVKKLKHIANVLFIGAILAPVLLFLLGIFSERFSGSHAEEFHHFSHSILVLLTHSFLVISATILGYNEKMIFEEQSKIYHQMFQLFSLADDKLSKAIDENNYEEAYEIIWELGLESLMENADWLILHRSRPMEMPKG